MSRRTTALLLAFSGLVATILAATFLQGVEERASKRYRALDRLAGRVQTADPSRVDPKLEGKLVRLEGMAVAEGPVEDPELGVDASGLLLSRSVEMWQWLEEEVDGETVYELGWSDELGNSDEFAVPEGHQNPAEPRLPPAAFTPTVTVGEFVVPDKLVRAIQKREPLPVSSVEGLPETLRPASLRDGVVYVASDPDNLRVGDLRISFAVVRPLQVRLLGIQRGNTLTHFGNSKNPRYLVLKIDDQPLFANLDTISPAQIWVSRAAAFAGLVLGLALLRQALPPQRRPGFGAVVLLALAAGFGTAAAAWPEVSSLHAWSFCGVALFCALAGLLWIRTR